MSPWQVNITLEKLRKNLQKTLFWLGRGGLLTNTNIMTQITMSAIPVIIPANQLLPELSRSVRLSALFALWVLNFIVSDSAESMPLDEMLTTISYSVSAVKYCIKNSGSD